MTGGGDALTEGGAVSSIAGGGDEMRGSDWETGGFCEGGGREIDAVDMDGVVEVTVGSLLMITCEEGGREIDAVDIDGFEDAVVSFGGECWRGSSKDGCS
jgi:hypothetical protein